MRYAMLAILFCVLSLLIVDPLFAEGDNNLSGAIQLGRFYPAEDGDAADGAFDPGRQWGLELEYKLQDNCVLSANLREMLVV